MISTRLLISEYLLSASVTRDSCCRFCLSRSMICLTTLIRSVSCLRLISSSRLLRLATCTLRERTSSQHCALGGFGGASLFRGFWAHVSASSSSVSPRAATLTAFSPTLKVSLNTLEKRFVIRQRPPGPELSARRSWVQLQERLETPVRQRSGGFGRRWLPGGGSRRLAAVRLATPRTGGTGTRRDTAYRRGKNKLEEQPVHPGVTVRHTGM
ncbi:hypothetical protein EYF80_043906 [Liparis tanakae]|uniref:Uncharacterized protein n=1 Tax=Liparis tanakae TaxID=230148 RepID=A0A4Z2FXB4_9TELE|nr:hypothetical protein EYF80_043906 [Liparis tanakae]